jgi:choline dehydrogenase-like flavoprotein
VLANRLSEDPSVTVLLVERGAPSNSYQARIPLLSANINSPNSPVAKWPTAPLINVDNRTLELVAAHCLGGNSRINGCIYTRGAASEYNRWSASGRKGWAYNELEPYFIKSEGILQRPVPKHHGGDGASLAISKIMFLNIFLVFQDHGKIDRWTASTSIPQRGEPPVRTTHYFIFTR